MSDYILTYSKTKFYLLKPSIDDIKIEDIAHALSLMTRANGHFKHFYSVGQHCINCYKEAKSRGYSERIQLGCLLHDASESYISDLTRPVKNCLKDYFSIEQRLQKMIYEKFGLTDLVDEEIQNIKEVDDSLLYFEFEELMGVKLEGFHPYKGMEHSFSLRDFSNVENEFLHIFKKLKTDKRAGIISVGIDGCRAGWVAVNITDTGFEVELYKNIEEVCSKYSDSDCMLVDMPIGLPESPNETRPDSEARQMLSGRTSCIFNTPCRQAVYIEDYQEANLINKTVLGKGLSKQSFAISNNIREIDELLNKFPEYREKLVESHPEICFAVLASAERDFVLPLYNSKHTEEGMYDRLDTLRDFYDKTDDFLEYICNHPKLSKIMEDCIDALCLAVTGMLGLKNGLVSIPEKPEKDSRGLLMQMKYAGMGKENS